MATGDSGSEVRTSQSEASEDDEPTLGPSSEVRQRRPATNKQELEVEEVSIYCLVKSYQRLLQPPVEAKKSPKRRSRARKE